MNLILILILVASTILSYDSESVERKSFPGLLTDPCMILNYEQDNTIEGEYLTVESINNQDSTLMIKLPENFYINATNLSDWLVGWGEGRPFYDAGCENLRVINEINSVANTLNPGSLVRGEGFPQEGERVVFWNRNPSGFINKFKRPVIDPSVWPEFAGRSISFSSIEYDRRLNKWVMIVNEVDTSKIQIYAAVSYDLLNWEAGNNGKPVLTADDFKSCTWAGRDRSGLIKQAPFVSDIVRFKKKWYLFLDGYSADGKRHIGVAISKKSLTGPYKVLETPLLSPGAEGSWNDQDCYYAKVEKYGNEFIMFYDGKIKDGTERIGMATSKDLIIWKNSDNNPVIDQHTGWRSSPLATEPCYIEIVHDTIKLMIGGFKEFERGTEERADKRAYRDRSGNVDDFQVGIYYSADGGKTFIAHMNNPVFTNDYSNPYENEHLGGNFRYIKNDSVEYIFYQAKSSYEGAKYNILRRERRLK
jgi:hypothetical protein